MFQKAERRKAKLRLGIAGPAGCGKTYSALLIAKGLGGRIALLDTEHGSGEMEAGKPEIPDYDACRLEAPYTPERYLDALHEAEKAGYSTVIIDSASHAWAGKGGLLEDHDRVSASGKKDSFRAWGEITPRHNEFVDTILASPCHIIVTFRTKTDYLMSQGSDGKTRVQKVGLAPVQREGMEYEMSVFLEQSLDHSVTATKDRTSLLDSKTPWTPSAETGKLLAAWLETGAGAASPPPAISPPATPLDVLLAPWKELVAAIKNVHEGKNWQAKYKPLMDSQPPEVRDGILELLRARHKELDAAKPAAKKESSSVPFQAPPEPTPAPADGAAPGPAVPADGGEADHPLDTPFVQEVIDFAKELGHAERGWVEKAIGESPVLSGIGVRSLGHIDTELHKNMAIVVVAMAVQREKEAK